MKKKKTKSHNGTNFSHLLLIFKLNYSERNVVNNNNNKSQLINYYYRYNIINIINQESFVIFEKVGMWKIEFFWKNVS